jgi:tetratricopeptide (TPR) repeat protein
VDKDRIASMLDRQHRTAEKEIREKTSEDRVKIKYVREIKRLINKKDMVQALAVVRKVKSEYPEDPYINSYYGYLLAVAEKKYREGIKVCQEAIEALNRSVPFGSEFFYSFFYLNLGRAYQSAGMKKKAIKSFQGGLSYDQENKEIIAELRRLGIRRKLPVPFLPRKNPANKYLGLLSSKLKGKQLPS